MRSTFIRFTILQSNLVVIRRGRRAALLRGELTFANGYHIVIRERLAIDDVVIIEDYGYELWHFDEKLSWYDSQPHPHNPALASTDPHHKHIPPDIKHNHIPAPNMQFDAPNLPELIREVAEM